MAGNSGSDGEYYLVRGALLKCSCGSHPRRLNLPLDHGVTIETEDDYAHAFVHEMDCIPGPTGNVDYFGVCSNSPGGNPETIVLQAVDENGELTGGIVEGPKCNPVFVPSKWMDTKTDAPLGGASGKKMVTTKSCLMCPCGGIITPVTSGVEYKGDQL